MIKKNGKVVKVFTNFDGFVDLKNGDFYKMKKQSKAFGCAGESNHHGNGGQHIGRDQKMIIMPSNNTGFEAGKMFGKYPNRLAHLHSCERLFEPKIGIPWALDNGVFGAFSSGREWSEEPFYSFLDAFVSWKPMWVVVPDSVGNKNKTLEMWHHHLPSLKAFNVPLAFAVQDGMTPDDVPNEANIIFVGGSTSWKWKTLSVWTTNFPRVHVGRVNSSRLLAIAEENGAESCDGTGWFRDPKRTQELEDYLNSTNHQSVLCL